MDEKDNKMQVDTHWHLDKRVPVSIIFAILMQSVLIVWWSAKTDSRLEASEAAQQQLAVHQSEDKQFHTDQRVRLWDRVNTLEGEIQSNETNIAKAVAGIEHLTKQVDRLVVYMIDGAK
ncbi:hypothetical protein OAF54_00760 [bacterium]|nr:hypothetical protein [bacterium]